MKHLKTYENYDLYNLERLDKMNYEEVKHEWSKLVDWSAKPLKFFDENSKQLYKEMDFYMDWRFPEEIKKSISEWVLRKFQGDDREKEIEKRYNERFAATYLHIIDNGGFKYFDIPLTDEQKKIIKDYKFNREIGKYNL